MLIEWIRESFIWKSFKWKPFIITSRMGWYTFNIGCWRVLWQRSIYYGCTLRRKEKTHWCLPYSPADIVLRDYFWLLFIYRRVKRRRYLFEKPIFGWYLIVLGYNYSPKFFSKICTTTITPTNVSASNKRFFCSCLSSFEKNLQISVYSHRKSA